MSLTTSNFQHQSLKWREKSSADNLVMSSNEPDTLSSNVDDGLTSLTWLQNLNMCMTRLGAPTPPTPPASPICFGFTSPACNSPKRSTVQSTATSTISKSKASSSNCNGDTFVNGTTNSTTPNPNGCRNKVSVEAQPGPTKCETTKKKASVTQFKNPNFKANKKCVPHFSQPPHCLQDIVDYKINGSTKPPYSYATLICMAMKANKNKMTLSSIYKWIKENFLYYKNADPSWQNSIRHNLSLNKCFIKIPRNKDEPGKGGFWKLDPIYADSLVDGIFKKRRPNQKPNQSSDEPIKDTGIFKRKPRKKNPSVPVGFVKTTTKISQETPPNSAESYNYKEKLLIDTVELNNAVNSIDNGSCTYTYTLHSANIVDCEQSNVGHEYANEVCIGNPTTGECIIESDGNDICWNAIFTEADLNDLVDPISYTDSVTQIIHPIENEIHHASTTKANTASLTAVEPHELDMIASSTNLLDDQQIFYHESQLHNIPFDSHSGNVITATSNVVTCINDTNISGHWNEWNLYPNNNSMQLDCANHNAELILSQIEHGPNSISINEINLINNDQAYLPANSAIVLPTSDSLTSKHTTISRNDVITTLTHQLESNSQSPTNYDSSSSLQPWIECKTNALEIDTFNNLEQMQHF